VFNQTGLTVAEATGGQQQPWMSNSPIRGQFFFVPPAPAVTVQTPASPVDPEVTVWQSIQDSGDIRSFRSYLQRYPSGKFAAQANQRIAALSAPAPPAAAPSAAAPPVVALNAPTPPAAASSGAPAPPATTGQLGLADDGQQLNFVVRFTTPGQEVLIAQHSRWNSRCEPEALPVVEVLTKPANGTVDVRPGVKKVSTPPRAGKTDCRGRELPSNDIWYTPAPGYHGTDQFDYNVTLSDRTLHDRAVVDVSVK
jgi:hypothetical protein